MHINYINYSGSIFIHSNVNHTFQTYKFEFSVYSSNTISFWVVLRHILLYICQITLSSFYFLIFFVPKKEEMVIPFASTHYNNFDSKSISIPSNSLLLNVKDSRLKKVFDKCQVIYALKQPKKYCVC